MRLHHIASAANLVQLVAGETIMQPDKSRSLECVGFHASYMLFLCLLLGFFHIAPAPELGCFWSPTGIYTIDPLSIPYVLKIFIHRSW